MVEKVLTGSGSQRHNRVRRGRLDFDGVIGLFGRHGEESELKVEVVD